MQDIIRNGNLRNENLRALAHHEHWEIIVVLIVRLHVLKNCSERFVVFLVDNSFNTITWAVDTIYLVKHVNDIFLGVKI